MNLGVLGSLLVEIKANGAKEARQEMEGMQGSTKKAGDEAKRSVPTLEKMGKRWASVLNLVSASGAAAFNLIAKSSPAVMGSLKGISLAFESIFMIIGDELAPVFETFEGILWKISEWFDGLSPSTKTFIAALVGAGIVVGALLSVILALVTIGPTLIPALATAFGAVAGAVGLSVGSLIAVVAGLVIVVALLYTAWKNNWFGIRDKTQAALAYISELFARFKEWVGERWNALMSILHDENLSTYGKLKAIWGWVKETIAQAIDGLKTEALKIWESLKTAMINKAIEIRDKIPGYIDTMKVVGLAILTDLKLSLIELWGDIKKKASEKWEEIKYALTHPIETATSIITEKLNGLKSILKGVAKFFELNPISIGLKVAGAVSNYFSGSSGGKDKTQYDSSGRVASRQKVSADRALGGPVLSGMSYLVGENGPEMFTPRLSGSITPTKRTQQALTAPTQSSQDLNMRIEVNLDGRKIWESVRKYSAAEMRRLGAY